MAVAFLAFETFHKIFVKKSSIVYFSTILLCACTKKNFIKLIWSSGEISLIWIIYYTDTHTYTYEVHCTYFAGGRAFQCASLFFLPLFCTWRLHPNANTVNVIKRFSLRILMPCWLLSTFYKYSFFFCFLHFVSVNTWVISPHFL